MDQNTAEPIRVLQINSGSRSFGGVSSFLYNVYTNIDRKQVQFDFLSPNVTTYGIHRDEIEEMGGRIYELGVTGNILTKKTKKQKRNLVHQAIVDPSNMKQVRDLLCLR